MAKPFLRFCAGTAYDKHPLGAKPKFRIFLPQPTMRTEKDIGSENPETTTVSGFFRAIDRDNVKICLGTGHVAVFPHLSVGDAVRRPGYAVCVLHIHDNDGSGDSHDTPGTGRIDRTDFLHALNESAYNSVLSLETSPSGGLDDTRFAEESIRLCEAFRRLITQP